ncbi:MAG: hypothetical protein Q9166_006227 [cf. Caloplaca sp. 2 TL-2023]
MSLQYITSGEGIVTQSARIGSLAGYLFDPEHQRRVWVAAVGAADVVVADPVPVVADVVADVGGEEAVAAAGRVESQQMSRAIVDRTCFADAHSALGGDWASHDGRWLAGCGADSFEVWTFAVTRAGDYSWKEIEKIVVLTDSSEAETGKGRSGSGERSWWQGMVERKFGSCVPWDRLERQMDGRVQARAEGYGMESDVVADSKSRMGRLTVETLNTTVLVWDPV